MKKYKIEVKLIETYHLEVNAETPEKALRVADMMTDNDIIHNADLMEEDREDGFMGEIIPVDESLCI